VWWRALAARSALAALAALATGCERERRIFDMPPHAAAAASVPAASSLLPGPASAPAFGPTGPAAIPGTAASAAVTVPTAARQNAAEHNAYLVAQGKLLYRWFNCAGCHANGGGGMGPALMDAEWRYGSSPAQVAASILQGRPGGMPAFAGRIPQDQVWQLVAYVRSMSGQVRADVAPGRSDALSPGEPELRRDPLQPRPEVPR
jgi:cytochrome c oxidase cbb3-type subunit 3